MAKVKEIFGLIVMAFALAALVYAVFVLRTRDYVATMLLSVIGFSLLRASTELLRPTVGE